MMTECLNPPLYYHMDLASSQIANDSQYFNIAGTVNVPLIELLTTATGVFSRILEHTP